MPLPLEHRYPALQLGRREPFIFSRVQGKCVLDLGFMDTGLTTEKVAAKGLLHLWVKDLAASLVGVDMEPGPRHLLPPDSQNYRLYFGNVEEKATYLPLAGEKFDLILAAEIMEHLCNPGRFLDAIRLLLAPQGRLLITVPNGLRFQNIVYAHQGLEMINDDHCFWYSPTTIQALLNKSGYHVLALRGYTFGNETLEQLGPFGLACPGLIVEAAPAPAGETPRRWDGQPPQEHVG